MPNFIFFGSSDISVTVLEALKAKGFLPSLIITKPDAPQGRGLVLTPSVVKTWALQNNIAVETPEKIRTPEFVSLLKSYDPSVAILVSYGKIIPKSVIEIFEKGIINVHPSLLPKLRGPAPIEYTILNDMKDEVGVSIMLLDEGMDTGPTLSMQKIETPWPIGAHALYQLLSTTGAELLVKTLPLYLSGQLSPKPQEDAHATYSKIIEKSHGELLLTDDGYKNYLKFLAYEGWPGVFYFEEKEGKKMRVKITKARFEDKTFIIERVIPEGKKEMDFESFKRGL